MRALVTGGTRGIGRAIASLLLDQGYEVIITGRQTAPALHRSVQRARFVAADFTEPEDLKALCHLIRDDGLDVLVNNAGVNRVAPFRDLSAADFDHVLNVNLRATFLTSQAAVASMADRGYGRICTLSSVWGLKSTAGRAAYSASKFAVRGLTASIASEFASDGILANCVAPGFIETDLTRAILTDAEIDNLACRIPMSRLGSPEDVARLVAWLVSDENTYVTGQTLTVDGGFLGA